jgi:hypothetical protein
MPQIVEYLPSKYEALSLNLYTAQKMNKLLWFPILLNWVEKKFSAYAKGVLFNNGQTELTILPIPLWMCTEKVSILNK